ncbi:MAG TPA: DUF3892 domain-containing protein [Niallia sp.]|nr:DUF3892 domain-containing protein [Niallia sp.]
MEQIIAVERNKMGDIINFKTSMGRIISYRKAILEIESGVIDGVEMKEVSDNETFTNMIVDNFESFPDIYSSFK